MVAIFQDGRQFNNVLTCGKRSNCDTSTKFAMNIPERLYYKKNKMLATWKSKMAAIFQDGHPWCVGPVIETHL